MPDRTWKDLLFFSSQLIKAQGKGIVVDSDMIWLFNQSHVSICLGTDAYQ